MLLEEFKVTDSVKYNDSLSDKLWTQRNTLRPDVSEALKKIADTFIDTLNMSADSIVDVILTGSMTNYNYTKYSDIDLHIVIDYDNLCKDCVKYDISDCMDAKRALWNERHDITIYDIDVELYVHDAKNKITGNAGVYSLKHDKWLRIPKREVEIKYDESIITSKVNTLKNQIDSVINDQTIDDISKLQEKIRNMRKSGLEKHGEYSMENIVFKILRNSGHMNKLYDAKLNKTDSELSLK